MTIENYEMRQSNPCGVFSVLYSLNMLSLIVRVGFISDIDNDNNWKK